jgi:hypothetical protein
MKLRISGDSVRLRLRKPEVRQLLESGSVAGSTAFAPDVELHYRLEIAGQSLTANFNSGDLTIRVPRADAQQWAQTDQVGIEATQPAGSGRTLQILIEKDFACRDATHESQEGTYENPAGAVC